MASMPQLGDFPQVDAFLEPLLSADFSPHFETRKSSRLCLALVDAGLGLRQRPKELCL